jgi:hypothetical protein
VRLDPILNTDLILKDEPNCAAFTTLTLNTLPALCIPNTLTHDANLENTRNDRELPNKVNPKVEILPPDSTLQRIDKLEPHIPDSMALKKPPICARLPLESTDTELDSLVMDLKLRDDPRLVKAKIESLKDAPLMVRTLKEEPMMQNS